MLSRRHLLRAGILGGALLALDACTFSPPRRGSPTSGYGPLGPPDANGVALPAGFRARLVAREGDLVAGTSYRWHGAPDGGRAFATTDGWVYVSNSEIDGSGGVGMIRFNQAGTIIGAQRLLDGTSRNCSGGHTTWGTWLSCEEVARGRVYEVHPLGLRAPRSYAAMGRFQHEGAAVDGVRQTVYLTEDESSGLFYRYRYSQPANLSGGALEAARVVNGLVTWLPVPDPAAARQPTRLQVPAATTFGGAEGVWYANDVVNFTTKVDDKVWAYNVVTQQLRVVYDWRTNPNPVLRGVDNLTARNGSLFVCEDRGLVGFSDDPKVCLIAPNGQVSEFLRLYGQRTSELTGAAFNPRGDRLYVSSQRGADGRGLTYEISGPF